VLNGRKDYVTAPENAFCLRSLAALIQAAVLRIIPDAGHAICQERPEEVARVIAEFLEAKTGAPASAS
jgi:pimeloyl-ACP methyl ester carboxylesterase